MLNVKGIEYLQNLKNLPRKKNDKTGFTKMESPKTERIIYKNYLTHHTASESENSKKKSWSRILDSTEDKQSKALKIQFESQRLEEELKRK